MVRAGGHLEVAFPDFVETRKIVEVGQEDLRFDDMVERAARRRKRPLQIFQDVVVCSLMSEP